MFINKAKEQIKISIILLNHHRNEKWGDVKNKLIDLTIHLSK